MKPAGHHRPHPYSPDCRGSVRRSIADAVDDRSAFDAGTSRKSGCRQWFTAIAAGLIAGIGLAVGFVIMVVIL